jgi:hypothetical protein
MPEPKRKLVAEQWDKFARAALPINTSAVQRQEMRRAFYAGAEGVLLKVIAAFAPESEPTAADLQMMTDVHEELQEFNAAVQQGRA